MSNYTFTIPATLYDKARRVAEQTDRPVDEVIRSELEQSLTGNLLDLPDDERAELRVLVYLSDDTLWTLAREQMVSVKKTRMQVLMDKNTFGTITDAESKELSRLVETGERLMLRKSEAMKLLTERGYAITLDGLKPADE